MDVPTITDDEIAAGVRSHLGAGAGDVHVLKRRRLRPTAGLTGSYFERVQLRIDGRKVPAVLKWGALPGGPPLRERLFFSEFSGEVPIRAPRCYGVGPTPDGFDGWVLMERLGRGKRIGDWTAEETRGAIRGLAALHAKYLGAAPSILPRPFTAQLEHSLSFIPAGVQALREIYEQYPHLPRVATERALELLLELSRRPRIFGDAFARSPETLLHGDYHRGNMVLRDGEPLVAFDWQFACAGPPAYDVGIFWLFLGAVNKPALFGLIERAEVRERSMSLPAVQEVYAEELRRLRPDADVDAVLSCAEEALAWEAVRQGTYAGPSMRANFEGFIRFIYRDHRTIGGWFARWLGIEHGWSLFREVFTQFEERAERMLARADGPG